MKWFVLFEPDYRTPSVFNLHDRGLFISKPSVTCTVGARVVVNEKNGLAIYGRQLIKTPSVDEKTGRHYRYKTEIIIVSLTQKLTPNKKEFNAISSDDLRGEITAVYETWYSSHLPRRKDGKIDRTGLNNQIARRMKA